MPEENIKPTENSPSLLSNVAMILLSEFLNYIKFSQMTWMILLYAALIVIILAGLQDVYSGGDLLGKIPGINKISSLNSRLIIGQREILKIYGWLSLFVFGIGRLSNYIFNIKILWNFKKKVLLAVSTAVIGYGFVFIFILPKIKLAPDTRLSAMYLMCFLFLILTILASIYSFIVSHLVNKAMTFLSRK